MYAQLGNIRFEGLKGFSAFSHDRGVNYAQHELINGKPRLQAVGDNLDNISFSMYLHSEFTNPEADIENLRLAMQNREILPLLLGNGRVLGFFVIPNFSQVNSFTDPKGNLIEVTLSVELLESFSDDPLRQSELQAIQNSFATSQRNSNVRSVLPPKLSEGMGMTAEISKIQTSATVTGIYTAKIEAIPSRSEYWSGKINKSLTDIEGRLTTVQSILSDASNLQDLAQDMPVALNDVYVRVQNMKAVLPVSDVNSFKILNQQLSGSIVNLNSTNLGISNNSIIRRV
jgi:phage protein U